MPARSGPRLVSRHFMHTHLRDRIGVRIEPALLDRFEAKLKARFEAHVRTLQQAREREMDLRAFHAIEEFCPPLRRT